MSDWHLDKEWMEKVRKGGMQSIAYFLAVQKEM